MQPARLLIFLRYPELKIHSNMLTIVSPNAAIQLERMANLEIMLQTFCLETQPSSHE
jgi:hypothetical protein